MGAEIAKALAAQPGGVTSQDMASAIAKALAAQPGVTTQDVAAAIAKALEAQPGVSQADVAKAIETALAQQPGISPEDIKKAVESAVAQAFPTTAPQEALAVAGPAMVNPNAKYGGILNLGDYVFPNLIFKPYEDAGALIKNQGGVYSGLIEFNPETDDIWDVRGDLADSWKLADDGMTYTFNINTDAVWHDGQPVTAEDVVFSIDSMMDPDATRPTNASLRTYLKPGNSRVIGRKTVEIKINYPSAEFLPVFAIEYVKIYAKHWVESTTDFTWENQMGTGPFLPGELKKDISLELEKNPNYWKEGLPYVDGMVHFTLPKGPSMIAAFRTGQILGSTWFVVPISNKEAVKLGEEAKDKLTVLFSPNVGPAGMIMTVNPPFDDIRVRQAFNLAFDRHEFVEVFGAGPGTDAVAPFFGVGTWYGYTAEMIANAPGFRQLNGEKHPDDIAEAKRLLLEAIPDGFKADNTTDHFTYSVKDGYKFTMMTRRSGDKVSWGELQVEQLNRFLDIDATLAPIDSAAGIERYLAGTGKAGAGDFLVAAQDFGQIMQPSYNLSDIKGFLSTVTGWWETLAPQWFKDATDEQARELDPVKRRLILLKMQKYLIEEDPGPLLSLWHSARPNIVNNKLKNYHLPPFHIASMKWEHVWCDPSC